MQSIHDRIKSKISHLIGRPSKNPNRPNYPTISLTRWRHLKNYPNFGDDLSHTITTLMLAKYGRTLEDESFSNREMLAIGSIIHLADTGAVVWGSGVNGKVPEKEHRYKSLDIRAVRGPYTRDWLKKYRNISSPEIYGDPALLLPHLTKGRFCVKDTNEQIFIPNINDFLYCKNIVIPDGIAIVNPMQSWHRVVDRICAASFVVSSSLHGLILAEAFGIGARYVRLSEIENLFKFQDYYSGTGRHKIEIASSLEEAMEMGPEKLMNFDHYSLERAFPFELWLP